MPYALVKDSTGEILQIGPGMYAGNIPNGVTPYDVGDDIVAGMLRQEDGSFANPPPPEEVLSHEGLKAYAARKRYEAEIAGISVAGTNVATDRQSQQLINGVLTYATLNPSLTISFKDRDGDFVPMDATAVQLIAMAVASHVQACFAKEAEVVEDIYADQIDSHAEIDAAFKKIASA